MIEKSFTYQQSILILIFTLCTLNSQIQLLRFKGFIAEFFWYIYIENEQSLHTEAKI